MNFLWLWITYSLLFIIISTYSSCPTYEKYMFAKCSTHSLSDISCKFRHGVCETFLWWLWHLYRGVCAVQRNAIIRMLIWFLFIKLPWLVLNNFEFKNKLLHLLCLSFKFWGNLKLRILIAVYLEIGWKMFTSTHLL